MRVLSLCPRRPHVSAGVAHRMLAQQKRPQLQPDGRARVLKHADPEGHLIAF